MDALCSKGKHPIIRQDSCVHSQRCLVFFFAVPSSVIPLETAGGSGEELHALKWKSHCNLIHGMVLLVMYT